jgi:hypothetical protein
VYREKYASGDHGMPNPNGKKSVFFFKKLVFVLTITQAVRNNLFYFCILHRPFRGDFLIHPDWNPRLRHHRLPYMY